MGYFSMGYDGFDRNHHQKLQRSWLKKFGSFLPSSEMQMLGDYLKHDLELLDGSDLDEYRLRGASAAARHALTMAKLKREKAHRLMFRADAAVHKAVFAVMTVVAVKASYMESNDNPNGDEKDDLMRKLIRALSCGIEEYSRHCHCFCLLVLPFLVMVAWSPC
ncbi:hypothetical protein SLEP1_g49496 [Rubroshorea leprosula]|uniref:Uncharacterized protein n=1 Tax=Rubroshorea leprosula TaxID=152421 RepID=A0AAV5LX51_9ROSI|nr:hypothetical protein SLEP1_g49496 [Rubroshorea leprosula]